MKYNDIIFRLEKIIENWYDKEYLHNHIEYPRDGLCDNITGINTSLIPEEAITSWCYYNGNISFPVGGLEEYERAFIEPYILFTNPKRLHLAVHMLQWFRFHNKE